MTASPYATGGGGTGFEWHVAAFYLASLLLGSVPRGLDAGVTRRVSLQCSHEGEPLDDLKIVADLHVGQVKLTLQVKRDIAFTPTNSLFDEVLRACWDTFRDPEFRPGTDRFGIVVGVYNKAVAEHIQTVLTWARTSANADAFARIYQQGFSSHQQRDFVSLVREKLNNYASGEIGEPLLWDFLRSMVILHFDFEDEGSRDRSYIVEMLRHALSPDRSADAGALFARLFEYASEAERAAGIFDRQILTAKLAAADFPLTVPRDFRSDLDRLREHADFILNEIRTDLGGLVLNRGPLLDSVRERAEASPFIAIVGAPGVGKSALLKQLVEVARAEGPVVVLASHRLSGNGWDAFASDLRLMHTLRELLIAISNGGRPCLFVDGIDRITEAGPRRVLNDLLYMLGDTSAGAGGPGRWRIIGTCQEQNFDEVRGWIDMRPFGMPEAFRIPDLADEEVQLVAAQSPRLALLLSQPRLAPIVRNIFMLSLLGDPRFAPSIANLPTVATETEVSRVWWARIVGAHERGPATGLARQHALLELGGRIIGFPGRQFPASDMQPDVIAALVREHILLKDQVRDVYRFGHDILQDWVLCRVLAQADDLPGYLRSIGEPSGLIRAVQLVGLLYLESGDVDAWVRAVDRVAGTTGLAPRWLQALISAPLLSPRAIELLENARDHLLAEDGRRLSLLLNAVRPTEVPEGIDEVLPWLSAYVAIRGRSLIAPLLHWLRSHAEMLPAQMRPTVIAFMVWWQEHTPERWHYRLEVGQWALAWLAESEAGMPALGFRDREKYEEPLRAIVLRSTDVIPSDVDTYLEALANSRFRRTEKEQAFTLFQGLIAHLPTQYVNFALRFLVDSPKTRRDRYYDMGHSLGIHAEHQLYPAAHTQGPFLPLLRINEREGMRLIHGLTNAAIANWWRQQQTSTYFTAPRTPLPARIHLPFGNRAFWGDAQVYRWYRPHGVAPHAVASALMALEVWMEEQIASGRDAQELFSLVLRGSACIALPAVCLSVALAYPKECLEAAWPLIASPHLWRMDMVRAAYDRQKTPIIDPFDHHKRIFEQVAARDERPQRKETLHSLVAYLVVGDEAMRERLFSAFAQFTSTLPFFFSDERESPAKVQSIYDEMEIYQANGDPANYRFVAQGDDVAVFFELPAHLREKADPGHQWAQTVLGWMGLATWSQGVLDGKIEAPPALLAEAVAAAQRAQQKDDFTKPSDGRHDEEYRLQAIAGVAAATLVGDFTWATEQSLVPWCRAILLRAARMPRAREVALDSFLLEPAVSAGRGLGALVARSPHDREIRETLLRLVAIGAVDAVFRGLRNAWEVDPTLCWNALRLTVSLSVLPWNLTDDRTKARRQQLLTSHVRDVRRGRIRAFPEIYVQESTIFWFEFVQHALVHLPLQMLVSTPQGKKRLMDLHDDLMRWTVTMSMPEDASMQRHQHRSDHPFWDRFFLDWGACLTRSLTPDEVRRHVLTPIREAWTEAPALTEYLLVGYLRHRLDEAEISAAAREEWAEICTWVLTSPQVQRITPRSYLGSELSEALSLIVFVRHGGSYWMDSWSHAPLFDDIIDRWVHAVGTHPDCYHDLVTLLNGPGQRFSFEKTIEWLSSAIDASPDAQALLERRSNGILTLGCLGRLWDDVEQAIRENELLGQRYARIVDHLVLAHIPTAELLQQRIEQVQRR